MPLSEDQPGEDPRMTIRPKKDQDKYNIDLYRLHLSVRWNTFLLPFEQRKFISALSNAGYAPDEATMALGPSQESSGIIARKGRTALTMDTSKPTMGLEYPNGPSLVEEFDSLEQLLRNELYFDSTEHAYFYEVLANSQVWTKKDAISVLGKAGITQPVTIAFSEKTGMGPATNVSLRLVPVNAEVQSSDWWDVHIEPSFRSPHHCYHVHIVFRNPERDKVIELARDIEQLIRICIELVED